MKKYSKILPATLLLLLSTVSCKKNFLAEQPYSTYNPQTLTDSLGVQSSLVGLYYYQSGILAYSGAQGWPCVWQVGTDVANSTANQQGIEIPYYNYGTLTNTDGAASLIWSREYRLIENANTIIDAVENPSNTSMSATGKALADAEAKFFRAYAYETLVVCFGGVPLVVHGTTTPENNYVRASVADVNAQQVADLTYAATNLPDVGSLGSKTNAAGYPASRANKYMAMQLLAEVYLREKQYSQAEQECDAIINSGKFSLVSARFGVKTGVAGDYYSDIFQYGNQRRSQSNPEVIWTLEQENPNTVVGGIADDAQQRRCFGAAYYNETGMVICDSLGGRGIGRLRLSNWVLYGLYSAGDIRNSQYNIHRRYYYNDPTQPTLYGKQIPFTGPDTLYKICPSTTKWGAFDPNDTFGYAMIKDFILMRLGETYLLLAEAQLGEGNTAGAAASINVLRTRAQAPQVNASQITLDFVLDERARELVGEENRRMTLMRTGTLVTRALRLNANDPAKPITGLTNTNLLMPIPLTEIELDSKLTQNPGY
jgi:starch-binding outer membrane protein, SusD/RagB family